MKTKWYTSPELLRAAREKYGTFEAIEREVGGADKTTLALHWRKMRLEELPRGPAPKMPVNTEALKELHQNTYGKST